MGGIWAPPTDGGTTVVELQDGRGSDAVRDAALVGLADAATALQQLDEPQGETILKQIFYCPDKH